MEIIMDYKRPKVDTGSDAVICNKCGMLITKDDLNYKSEVRRKELNAMLLSGFKSPYTLVLAIAMTVITVCCFVNLIMATNMFVTGINIWLGSVALINCIGIWKLWGFDKNLTAKAVRSFKKYLSLQRVLNIISLVLIELLAALILTFANLLTIAFDKFSVMLSEIIYDIGTLIDYNITVDPDTILAVLIIGPALLFIVGILIAILAIVYYTFINRAIKKVINHINRLSSSVESDEGYDVNKKPPFISLLIFGVINLLCCLLLTNVWMILYTIAIGVYFIFIALLFKHLHNETDKYDAVLIGTSTHKFMELCDPKNLDTNGVTAEIDRLVGEGKLSPDDVDLINLRLDEMEKFRKSQVFKEILEAKRDEDARLADLLENIRKKGSCVAMKLPQCIENTDLGKLFEEIQARTVIEELRKLDDPYWEDLADKLEEERRHYELPEEILRPEALKKIRESTLFEEIRKAKMLYREYPIFLPDTSSDMNPHSLAVLDCIIVKNEGDIVIIDYKTDRLDKHELKCEARATETFSFSYSPQFAKYADAVKLEFGKKPASAKLYSLQLGKALNIPINELPQKRYHYPEIKGRPS